MKLTDISKLTGSAYEKDMGSNCTPLPAINLAG